MKEFLKNIKDGFLDFFLKHNFIISTLINIVVLALFFKEIENYFYTSKSDILNMIISIAGTLFGFILTFLSIFIVFRTEKKYQKNNENKDEPIIMLINNESFNSVYELFIKSSYSLGLLLIVSIIFYFTTYGLNNIVNALFIIVIFELIVLGITRVFLSVYTFNTLIKILIQKDNKE